MNVVVLLPALASLLTPAVADGALCFEGTCLLGWIWSIFALTLASAWVVRRWQQHTGTDGHGAARLVPVVSCAAGSQSRTDVDRSSVTDLVAAGLGLRAPPTTDRAAAPVRRRTSLPPLRSSRPTGTPATPPGQNPPAR